jgi:hypothetical protein
VRPSPWRQAVDLGNMMLVLAVKSDADRVYRHAMKYFTPTDIAEAFAATRGVASPTQLRLVMKQDGRDLVTQFRRLAPERPPIGIQRWSVRRVALAAGLVVGLVAVIATTVSLLTPSGDMEVPFSPTCEPQSVTVLMAQSVPTATTVPCIATLPTGLTFDGATARNGEARFWLSSDRAGDAAVTVTFAGTCDAAASSGGSEPGRFSRVPGGCVAYDYSIPARDDPEIIEAIDDALGFLARDDLVAYVNEETGLTLCGAGTACPGTP